MYSKQQSIRNSVQTVFIFIYFYIYYIFFILSDMLLNVKGIVRKGYTGIRYRVSVVDVHAETVDLHWFTLDTGSNRILVLLPR